LFEDNAEFGLGMRIAVDTQAAHARSLVEHLRAVLGDELADGLLSRPVERGRIYEQRERVALLKQHLTGIDSADARRLEGIADLLVRKSVWLIGGDGWAYDIGYGGLDHVLATGRDVNILVLDTEVYSNTGGQTSKATPLGAVAKFSAGARRWARRTWRCRRWPTATSTSRRWPSARRTCRHCAPFSRPSRTPGPR